MSIVKSWLNYIVPHGMKTLLRNGLVKIRSLFSRSYPIISPKMGGEVVERIIEKHYETIHLANIHDFLKDGKIDFLIPELNLMRYSDAVIFPRSDFILVEQGAVWEKAQRPQFTKITPVDRDLVVQKDGRVFVRNPRITRRVNVGFSLCGVASWAWAHFVVQYIPKLFIVRDVKKYCDRKLTILLPEYADPQLRELVYTYLKKIEDIEIVELKVGEAARCDILYHVDNTAWLSEYIQDISPSDGLIPKYVADAIKANLNDVSVNVEGVGGHEGQPMESIFIARESVRNLTNYQEVKSYFIEKGYTVVHPHKLSLSDKIKIFRGARRIVGPLSGGFTNLFFCKPGTKVLVLSSYQRCYDTYLGFFTAYFGLDVSIIAGEDLMKHEINASFRIPFSSVKTICETSGF